MALSDSFHYYVSGQFGLVCDWNGTQNPGGNYTDITLKVYLRYYNLDVGSRSDNTVNINGTSSTFSTGSIYRSGASSYTNKLLTTKTVRVYHNADGTKTGVSLSARYHFNGTYSGSPVTWIEASTTVNLDPITIYSLSISAGSHSAITVNRTSSGFGATGNLTNGSRLYSGDKLKISFSADTGYGVGTHTVNGSSFTSGGTHTVAGNVTVVSTANALASTVSATAANIGAVSTVIVSKGNSSYYHSLQYSFGSGSSAVTGYITSSGGTSQSESKFQTTSVGFTVPTSFYGAIPNAKSGTCTITCRTYGSAGSTTLIGSASTCTFTVTAAESVCKPTVSGTVVDSNSTTVALTGDSSKLIRYKSTAKCTISASANNSATLSSRTINGSAFSSSSNEKSISAVETGQFVFKATDSRGYSNSVTVNKTVIQYVELTCNPTLKRVSPTSSTVNLTFSGAMYVGSFNSGVNNILIVEYRYKESTAASYPSAWTTVVSRSDQSKITYGANSYISNQTISLGDTFDYTKSYDFEVRVRDGATVSGYAHYLSTVVKSVTVSMGIPVFDWGKNDFNINVSAKGKVYGLGAGKSMIPSGADMNNYTEPGVYGVTSARVASAIANCPHDPGKQAYAGTLRVWVGRGNNKQYGDAYSGISQEYTDMNGATFRRMGDSDDASPPVFTWGKWYRIATYLSENALSPTVSVTNDTTTATGHSVYVIYHPELHMCFVRGYAKFDHVAVSANTLVPVASVPSQYAPSSGTALAASIYGGGNAIIEHSGKISVRPISAISSGSTYDIYFSGWWMV
jgi:hypothetical protein